MQGGNLFNNETFGATAGRCASCHVADLSLRFTPERRAVEVRHAASTFDPQFVGEVRPSSFDAGFDFNLNTLVLTARLPPTRRVPASFGDRHFVRRDPARGKVLTRVSPTAYLVYGGKTPS